MNYEDIVDYPLYKKMSNYKTFQLSYDDYVYSQISYTLNKVELSDNPYSISNTSNFDYLSIEDDSTYYYHIQKDENHKVIEPEYSKYLRSYYQHRLIGEILFGMGDTEIHHTRAVFNILDVLYNLGGIGTLVFVIVAFFISPIS